MSPKTDSSSTSSSSQEEEQEIEENQTNLVPADEEKTESFEDGENDRDSCADDGTKMAALDEPASPQPDGNSNKKTKKKTSVFTHEDEIALLRGLADFWAKEGISHEWKKFHEFIKDDLPRSFTYRQISEKIRRLKSKFEANNDAHFRDKYDSVVYDLSNQLWGNNNNNGNINIGSSSTSSKTKPKKSASRKIDFDDDDDDDDNDEGSKKITKKQKQVVAEDEHFDMDAEFPLFSALVNSFGCSTVKKKIRSICREDLEKSERKCKELIDEEAQLLRDHLHLRTKQMALISSCLNE